MNREEFLQELQNRTEAITELYRLLPRIAGGDKSAEKRVSILIQQSNAPFRVVKNDRERETQRQHFWQEMEKCEETFVTALSAYARLVLLRQEDTPQAQTLVATIRKVNNQRGSLQSAWGLKWGWNTLDQSYRYAADFDYNKTVMAIVAAREKGASKERLETLQKEFLRQVKIQKALDNPFVDNHLPFPYEQTNDNTMELTLGAQRTLLEGFLEDNSEKVEKAKTIVAELDQRQKAKQQEKQKENQEETTENNFYAFVAQDACSTIVREYVKVAVERGRESSEAQTLWQRLERIGKIAQNTAENNLRFSDLLSSAYQWYNRELVEQYIRSIGEGVDTVLVDRKFQALEKLRLFHQIPQEKDVHPTPADVYEEYCRNLLSEMDSVRFDETSVTKIERKLKRLEEKFHLTPKAPIRAEQPWNFVAGRTWETGYKETQLRRALLQEWRNPTPNEPRLRSLLTRFIQETQKRTSVLYAIARAEWLLVATETNRLEKSGSSPERDRQVALLKSRGRVLQHIVEGGPEHELFIDAPQDALWVSFVEPNGTRKKLEFYDGAWRIRYNPKADIPDSIVCTIVYYEGRREKRTITAPRCVEVKQENSP
jgi:hypothetical protein